MKKQNKTVKKCSDIFNDLLKDNTILIVKNLKENRTFIFNKEKTTKDDWKFMYDLVKNSIVDKSYRINDLATTIEVYN